MRARFKIYLADAAIAPAVMLKGLIELWPGGEDQRGRGTLAVPIPDYLEDTKR